MLHRKRIFLLTVLKVSSLAYFTDQNIMQKGDPMVLNFEVLEMQK